MSGPGEGGEEGYLQAFRGSFTSALRWHHLDALWERIGVQDPEGWYVYAVGQPPPTATASADQLRRFLDEVDELLRREHDEAYCGIVYADDLNQPGFVKIYDPGNLGVSCGFSDNPPLPGWVLSKIQPYDLATTSMLPGNRKRWWQKLFS